MVNLITSRFFFSGDIYLNPKNSLEVDETKLTKTQLLDIIEAHTLGTLTVSDIEAVRLQYQKLLGSNTIENSDLNLRLQDLEFTLSNLVKGEVSSVVYISKDANNIIETKQDGIFAEIPEAPNMDSFYSALDSGISETK